MSFLSIGAGTRGASWSLASLLPRLPRFPEITITIPSLTGTPASQNQPSNPSVAEKLEELRDEASEKAYADQSMPLWTGILNAAPKKKVSHQKKRQRQLAPKKKQLQFLNNLNRCPSCGHYKRSHTLCMHCVGQIKKHWKDLDQEAERTQTELHLQQHDVGKDANDGEVIDFNNYKESVKTVDERVTYPGKRDRTKLSDVDFKEKDEYLERRPKTLPVEK